MRFRSSSSVARITTMIGYFGASRTYLLEELPNLTVALRTKFMQTTHTRRRFHKVFICHIL